MKTLAVLVFVLLAVAGCNKSGEIKMKQRSEHNFGDGLRLTIGDIKLGRSADITVDKIGETEHLIEQVAHEGERINVGHDGNVWEIHILRFEDHTINDDFAYVKITRK